MATSVVYWSFKSSKETSTVAFEGTGISAFDLKKEIIASQNLGKGADFDFELYNPDTNEEYRNDNAFIPRATTVLARRAPPRKGPGRGNAVNYMVESIDSVRGNSRFDARGGGKWPAAASMSRRFNEPEEVVQQPSLTDTSDLNLANNEDADAIQAMMAASSEQWKQEQERMASGSRVPHGGAGRGRGGYHNPAPDRPPPASYYCHRCGKPGHWIQQCPTNDDTAFDNRPRFKRTTGIPRSFLVSVEAPEGEAKAGVMVTADGGFVVARPDSASWQQHRAANKNVMADDVEGLRPTDPDLTCPIDSKLLREAVKTPCCGTAFCEECIRTTLERDDLVCPECESKLKSLNQLKPDEERRARVKAYVSEMVKESEEAEAAKKADDDGKTEDAKEANGATPSQRSQVSKSPEADRQSTTATEQSSAPSTTTVSTNPLQAQVDLLHQQYMQYYNELQNPNLSVELRQQYTMQAQWIGAQHQMAQAQLNGTALPFAGAMNLQPMMMQNTGANSFNTPSTGISGRNGGWADRGSARGRGGVNAFGMKRDRPTDFYAGPPEKRR